MASSGEVRRRKNPKKTNPTISYPVSSVRDDASLKKRRHPNNDNYAEKSPSFSNSSSTGGSDNSTNKKEYDEYAWFIVFLTALSYFIITRGGNSNRGGVLSSFSKPYNVIASSVAVGNGKSEELLRSIFYCAKSQQEESSIALAPNHRLEVILSSPPDIDTSNDECTDVEPNSIPYLSHLSSTTWVHDEELGRGYLLLADAGRSGRIWRWEVGGGPITIGRSLHMERSGCRSGFWVPDDADNRKDGNGTCPENLFGQSGTMEMGGPTSCSKSATPAQFNPPLLGSASLAVELTRNAERSSAGTNIIVAEWGERRIVRVEGETGARTPLVTLVPTEKDDGHVEIMKWRRVFRPNHLTYTPFGDLVFSDNYESDAIPPLGNSSKLDHVGVVYRRKEAVHISPIAAEQSRDAHGWMGTTSEDQNGDEDIDILFQTSGSIGGLALGSDLSTLYILVTEQTTHPGWTKTVYKMRLSADEDEDSEDDSDDKAEGNDNGLTAFYKMTSADCKGNAIDGDPYSSIGSQLAVDEKGIVYMIGCPSSVTLLSQDDAHMVGTLTLDNLQKSQENLSNVAPSSFTSVSFGEDGYLYITSPNQLMRVKSRVGAMTLPTNMVVPPPLKPKEDGPSKPRRDKRDKL
ncbi:hypothetical protein ACHAXR_007133 [Thalassiosira sp. AJA248-18]